MAWGRLQRDCPVRNDEEVSEFATMARYYFDTRDDETFVPDDVGVEIDFFDQVKLAASGAMADFAKDVLPGSEVRNLAIEVRDHSGPVLRAALRFEIEHLIQATGGLGSWPLSSSGQAAA
jgi:hypothetical protein